MKNILLLFILLSFIHVSCSKELKMNPSDKGSDILDPIKDQYISLIPELKSFNHLTEGLNSTEDYIIVAGSSYGEILVAYIDKNSKKLVHKSIFDVKSKIQGDFLISEITISPAQLKNDAVSLTLSSSDTTNHSEEVMAELGALIVYPNSNELKHILIPYTEEITKEPLIMDFTFKTISFFLGDTLFMFDRKSTKELLASKETGVSMMVHPLAKIFIEGNKMVWVEFLANDRNKCIIKCFPLSVKDGQYTEIWTQVIPLIGVKYTDVVTHQFFLSDDEDNINLSYKAFGRIEEASAGNIKNFSEEYLYTFNKNTGK